MDYTHRTIQSTKSSKNRDKKYIHEIFVDHITKRTDLKQLCDKIIEQEYQYLNPAIISKSQVSQIQAFLLTNYQVLDLLHKLYEKEFGPVPVPSTETKSKKDTHAEGPAPQPGKADKTKQNVDS